MQELMAIHEFFYKKTGSSHCLNLSLLRLNTKHKTNRNTDYQRANQNPRCLNLLAKQPVHQAK